MPPWSSRLAAPSLGTAPGLELHAGKQWPCFWSVINYAFLAYYSYLLPLICLSFKSFVSLFDARNRPLSRIWLTVGWVAVHCLPFPLFFVSCIRWFLKLRITHFSDVESAYEYINSWRKKNYSKYMRVIKFSRIYRRPYPFHAQQAAILFLCWGVIGDWLAGIP